jgi:thiamine pyrophosphate-dependent acetolactate synthase large subunit-like protein
MTHHDGTYAAADNKCPHQKGGPLGAGSIEDGWLRCPWHGWDLHPTTGLPSGAYDDGVTTYPVEVREDGVYVGFPQEPAQERTATVFQTLSDLVPEDAIVPVDVGNNTYSFECHSQAVLMSGYLGSIGFALPAAFGAWAATQKKDGRFAGRQVVSVSGDGGLGQYLAELTTAVKYDMNITHVLLNNSELGKISKEQRSGNWEVWQTSLANPDFAAYAELCGAMGIRVESEAEPEPALKRAIAHDGPALVEILTDAQLI